MRAVLLVVLAACSSSPSPPERHPRHWPECSADQLHVDTADRHRCATVLRMSCERHAVEGPMLCSSMDTAMACAADCPCGLTDFGRDADGWRRCGRIGEDWALYP